mmetsp:Transcript_19368/g.39820  ORF Transcript_19368/g.39820 Transcript_19368/m.39820 type:complete len:129 (-) Transcript_19368:2115-2501(-)
MRLCIREASAIVFLTALTMAGSSENAEALSTSSEGGKVPQLPPPDPDSNLPSIKLGESIRFEEWGPIILNSDGTTRRISNWDTLTEHEKEVTWRRISKRNEQRRQVLLEAQKEAEAAQAEEESDAKEL